MQVLPFTHDNVIAVRVSDTFSSQEVDQFKALQQEAIEHYGEIRLYFEMQDFRGWQVDSFLENAFFDLLHAHQYSKVAMVGEKAWQAWLTKLVDLVKNGEVRYFDRHERIEAMKWLEQGSLRSQHQSA